MPQMESLLWCVHFPIFDTKVCLYMHRNADPEVMFIHIQKCRSRRFCIWILQFCKNHVSQENYQLIDPVASGIVSDHRLSMQGGDGLFNEVLNGLVLHRHKANGAAKPQRTTDVQTQGDGYHKPEQQNGHHSSEEKGGLKLSAQEVDSCRDANKASEPEDESGQLKSRFATWYHSCWVN